MKGLWDEEGVSQPDQIFSLSLDKLDIWQEPDIQCITRNQHTALDPVSGRQEVHIVLYAPIGWSADFFTS